MSDEADVANDYLEKWLQGRIEECQYQLNQAVFESGRCKNCDEKLDDGRTYCDTYCREDYELRLREAKRNRRYIGG